ncbi:hypothetical protein Tco_0189393 [Tanacetum coccineum]
MNYYRPPLVQLAVLDLQRVPAVPAVLSLIPVEWSPVPVVTASMSKSAQAAPVGYDQIFVMLQSLLPSCGLPVASLRSQFDSYSQLPTAVRSLVPMPPEKPKPPDLVVVQSHSGTDYHHPMSQLSDIFRSACPEYPLSQHRYPACPAPGLHLVAAADEPSPISYLGPRSIPNLFRGNSVISGLSALRSEDSNCKGGDEVGNTDAGGDAGSGGDGICGNGDDNGVSGNGGGVVKARSFSTSFLGGSDMDGSS